MSRYHPDPNWLVAGRFNFRYDKAMNNDCIFCKKAAGQLGELIWENDIAAAFYDTTPKAPIHVLIVPKHHYSNLIEASSDQVFIGQYVAAAAHVAQHLGVTEAFRYHINNGEEAGQVVDHLHAHILAAKPGEPLDKDQLHAAGL